MIAHPKCDYAACGRPAAHVDKPYVFCRLHWEQHVAERDGEDFVLSRNQRWQLQSDIAHALERLHGTLARARRHQREGDPLCHECRVAQLVAQNPTQARNKNQHSRREAA